LPAIALSFSQERNGHASVESANRRDVRVRRERLSGRIDATEKELPIHAVAPRRDARRAASSGPHVSAGRSIDSSAGIATESIREMRVATVAATRAALRRRRRCGGTSAMRLPIPGVVAALLLAASPATVGAEWTLKSGTGCVLESSPASLSDGYQGTTARVFVDAKKVSVTSPSVLDAGFKDIGIAVDEQPLIPMDRLADSRTAVFESRYDALVEQFKRGLRARVQLRFWPTWPATGTHPAVVSLIGFTKAHAGLEECK
jgi:hypothetical protein